MQRVAGFGYGPPSCGRYCPVTDAAFVTCEQRCLCTGFVCLDCIEDSSTSWQGVRGWEDAILAGCPARINVQLCCFCRVPLAREEVATLQEGASSQTCSWDTERVLPLCAFRPLVVIVLKEAFRQRAILLTQVLARHCGNVQTAVVPSSGVSILSLENLLYVGNSFSLKKVCRQMCSFQAALAYGTSATFRLCARQAQSTLELRCRGLELPVLAMQE